MVGISYTFFFLSRNKKEKEKKRMGIIFAK